MLKTLRLFLTYGAAAILCMCGFVVVQNLVYMEPGLHAGHAVILAFGGAFLAVSYYAVRHSILTRNHILIILIGIALFTAGLEYAVMACEIWPA